MLQNKNVARRVFFRVFWCDDNGHFNPLTPNDTYRGRTAPLTSKVAFYIFIQQI